MYTSISRVRTLTGFDDTTNISDDDIKSKIQIASGMVDSAAWYVYTLPFAYRYQNNITFTGRGEAWGGTIDIIVNGTTYTLTIAENDTPEIMADKFRIEAALSTDFKVDALGMGATVKIVSKTNSDTLATAYAEVNITDYDTSAWIGAEVSWRTTRYPVVLEQITAQIATALLFIDQYGIESQDTWKDGQTRMDVVDAILQKLQGVHESGQRISFFDEVTFQELTVSPKWETTSYPNDTSDVDPVDPTSPVAYKNKKF